MTSPPTSPLSSTTIHTKQGDLQGVTSEFDPNVTVFKGIRFAASTAGENRWRAPQPPATWEGVKICDTFGPECPQKAFGPMVIGANHSEDCLSLNVWSPAKSVDEALPVFVWIYGGRFIAGSGSQLAYEGTGLAKKGVVVVTLNYRVGILGFLATPELDEESGVGASGNYGILDQVAALQWVQQNIAAFGGDPTKVTISGQSAGGASCGIHVYSPVSKGLFRAAIPQAGMRDPHDPLLSGLAPAYRSKEKALRQGLETLADKGAANIAEARQMEIAHLISDNNKNDDCWGNPPFWRPCIDGYVLPDTYANILAKGLHNDVPVMTGHNADEGGTYADTAFTVSDLQACALQKYGDELGKRFIELYPAEKDSEALLAWNTQARNNSRVTVAMWAELYAKHAQSPVFGYFYNHAPPVPPGGPDAKPGEKKKEESDTTRPRLRIYEKDVPRSTYTYSKMGTGGRFGAFHGAEIPYALNNLYAYPEYEWQDDDRAVADQMSTYWSNFVKYMDPNGPQGGAEFVKTGSGKIMQLGDGNYGIPLAESPEREAFCREFLLTQKEW